MNKGIHLDLHRPRFACTDLAWDYPGVAGGTLFLILRRGSSSGITIRIIGHSQSQHMDGHIRIWHMDGHVGRVHLL